MKHSTLYDIADKLGISTSTVSRALNDHPQINIKTKQKVKRIAEELHYLPNTLAKNLKNKKSTTIGVIVPDIKHDFFSSAIGGIEEVAYDAGFTIIVTQSNEEFEREIINTKVLLHQRVAGVIVSISQNTSNGKHFMELTKRRIPLVFFDRILDEISVPKVIIDDYASSYNAVNYLISKGRRKIAHFAGHQSLIIYKKRLEGYINALTHAGIIYDDKLVSYRGYHEKDGYDSMDDLISKGIIPDAIFAINDSLAIGAFQRIKEESLRIPDDISLIGFSNMKISTVVDPPLTTVDQPSFEMGKKAAQLLIKLIANESHLDNPETIVLDTELIIRKST
jgi:DNA-binding LacI/PurR family transcriptional regulator